MIMRGQDKGSLPPFRHWRPFGARLYAVIAQDDLRRIAVRMPKLGEIRPSDNSVSAALTAYWQLWVFAKISSKVDACARPYQFPRWLQAPRILMFCAPRTTMAPTNATPSQHLVGAPACSNRGEYPKDRGFRST